MFIPLIVSYIYLQISLDGAKHNRLLNCFDSAFEIWSDKAWENDLDNLLSGPQPAYWNMGMLPSEDQSDRIENLLNGTKVHVLAVIEHGTRRIRILGATEHPVRSWVVQQARNLLMDLQDAGTGVKFVLHDRDASFTAAFDEVFQAAGVRIVRSAVQAPRMNSIMERWIGSCRRELLDRTLIWNQRHLMIVLREYEDFYNAHRPHRALTQAAPLRPLPDGIADLDHFRVLRRDRAGGMIHEYHLVA